MTPADIRLALRRHCIATTGGTGMACVLRMCSIVALDAVEARAVATWVRYGWTTQPAPTEHGLAVLLQVALQVRETESRLLARHLCEQWPTLRGRPQSRRPMPRIDAVQRQAEHDRLDAVARELLARRPTYAEDVARAAAVTRYKGTLTLRRLVEAGEAAAAVTRYKGTLTLRRLVEAGEAVAVETRDGMEYRRVGGYDD